MKRLVVIILAGAILCLVGSPSFARPKKAMDWGPSSHRLSEGMTEQQAIGAIGFSPNKDEQTTCGTQAASGPWTCRILTFGDSYNNLTVFERDDGDQSWVVNHWVVSD